MTDITLFGELRCPKTRVYQAALDERGLDYVLAEVDKDPDAARRLVKLAGSADKFPTFDILGRKLRNPTLEQLDKRLARAGFYDPGLVHEDHAQRFVRYMAPRDAFVSYAWQGDRMVLTHIEVPEGQRGNGIGQSLAEEVFDAVRFRPHEVRLTCPFLRKIAMTRADWRDTFNLGDAHAHNL